MEVNAINKKAIIKKENKRDITLPIFYLFVIIIMRHSFLTIERYILFILMFIWILFACLTNEKAFSKAFLNINLTWVYIYLISLFAISLFPLGIKVGLGRLLFNSARFMGIPMFIYYKNKYKYNYDKLKIIFLTVFIIWMYYCFKVIIFLTQNPGAARTIIRTGDEVYGNVAIGGGYGLAYGSAIIAAYLVSLLFKENAVIRREYKVILIAIILILFYLCIKAQSTITLLIFIIGILINVFVNIFRRARRRKQLRIIIFTIIIMVFLILVLISAKDIASWIFRFTSNNMQNNVIVRKLNSLSGYVISGEATGTFNLRIGLYKKSLYTFLRNPILGTAIRYGFDLSPVLGNHSELLDTFGNMGIVGGIPFIMIFITTIYKERKLNRSIDAIGYAITLLLLLTFNKFSYPLSYFVVFFIIPSLGLFFLDNRKPIDHEV